MPPTLRPDRPEPLDPAVVGSAIERLCEPGLSAAWLFGSHAAGRPHRESDVDVAVLLRRGLDAAARFAIRVRLSTELPARLGVRDVDVVILNDAPPRFASRVVLDGVKLFSRDEGAEHAFRRDVQLRAADLEPFLRRTRRVKLAALAS